MSNPRKSRSPLVDALRLFFRNPSAVIALVLILLLASAAVSGKLLTGKPPTPTQYKLMEEADELGDSVDLDVNPNAVMDPNQTMLRDKFLPPYSDSNMSKEDWQQLLIDSTPESEQETEEFKQQLAEVEPRTYWLGTDHLGRDVLAQLWAGSSISLTIGFLAVGISVLLGISLGGVAGFFGRRSVRLPMLLMLLFALVGGISIPAEAPGWGLVFFVLAGLAFGYQLVVALMGRRFRPVIGFVVVAIVVTLVFVFNWYTETHTPEGRMLQQARVMDDASHDVLLMTRDLGRARKSAENKEPGHRDEAWFNEHQLRLDVAYRNLQLLEREYNLVESLTELEKDARLGQDLLDRADHLEAHVGEGFNSELTSKEVEAMSPEDRREHLKYASRTEDAKRARETGQKKVDRAEAITAAIEPWSQAAFAAIEAERENMLFEEFDFQDEAARINRLLETDLALKRMDRAVAIMQLVEHLAAAFKMANSQPVALGEPLLTGLQKELEALTPQIAGLEAAVKQKSPAPDDKSAQELQALQDQLGDAKLRLEQVEAAIPFAEELKKLGTDLEAQFTALVEAATDL
jgi:ABC-type dipeptide/oligopeptide/nickel transport system permease subunit